jgi:hypothetical protein
MGFPRFTVGISRQDLTQDRLRDLRLWPGYETVVGVSVPAGQNGKFTLYVIEYGLAKMKHADRALGCTQSEPGRRPGWRGIRPGLKQYRQNERAFG